MKKTVISAILVLIISLSAALLLDLKTDRHIRGVGKSVDHLSHRMKELDGRLEKLEKQIVENKKTPDAPPPTSPPVPQNQTEKPDKSAPDPSNESNPQNDDFAEAKNTPKEKIPENTADTTTPPKKTPDMTAYKRKSAEIVVKLDERKEKLAKLKSANDNISAIKKEIARIDGIMNDNRYMCFDRCIHFEGIVFHRVMRQHKVMPSQAGYYHTINGMLSHKHKKKWNHVPVTYTCLVHKITWTEAEAENYKNNNYTPLPTLEIQKNKLERSLAMAMRRTSNAAEIKRLESEISDLEAKLTDLKKKYEITDADVAENAYDKKSTVGRSGPPQDEQGILEPDGSLILELGLDTDIRFRLDNGTLLADDNGNNYGGVGTHYELRHTCPKLFFDRPACRAGRSVWELKTPLAIPSHPSRITGVALLESGRQNVSINTRRRGCHISWNERSIAIFDNAGSSSRYKIKIYFGK